MTTAPRTAPPVSFGKTAAEFGNGRASARPGGIGGLRRPDFK